MYKAKKLLLPTMFMLIAMGSIVGLWALNDDYNRPAPLMDYAPQNIGIYDTQYGNLVEADCRSCHGNSLATRHHLSPSGDNCVNCHTIIPAPPGVTVQNDCLTSGCHTIDDIAVNGRYHHNTQEAATLQCTACHDPNIVAPLQGYRDPELYPPTITTPTPFSCENCHWGQASSAGHPCEDLDADNDCDGDDNQFGKEIKGNYDTHHFGPTFPGVVANDCNLCHAGDSLEPSWNPSDEQLIRFCEKCHDISTLHTIGPHVQASNGWEATGFYVGGGDDPTVSGTIEQIAKCAGCHADQILPVDVPLVPPTISLTADGIVPNVGVCGQVIVLRGQNFGDYSGDGEFPGFYVEMGTGGTYTKITTIMSWTDTLIEFMIPCDDSPFAAGTYDVRVGTPAGASNAVAFTLIDGPSVDSITPKYGPAGTWAVLGGDGFNASQSAMNGVSKIMKDLKQTINRRAVAAKLSQLLALFIIFSSSILNCSGEKVLARIGDKEITNIELEKALKKLPARKREKLRNRVLDNLIMTSVYSDEAIKNGLQNDPDVKAEMERAREEILARAFKRLYVDDKAKPTEGQMKKYYNLNRDLFKVPESVVIQHLLLKTKDRALKALKRLKKGESFVKLAKLISICRCWEKQGHHEPLYKGKMDANLAKAALTLEYGKLSDVIETKEGFQIIKVLKRKEAKVFSFKESLIKIRDKLFRESKARITHEYLKKSESQ